MKVGRIEQLTHTPGPWDDASKYPGIDSVRVFAKAHYVATVGNSDDPRAVTEANARLIAAAPDLLAACQALVDAGPPHDYKLESTTLAYDHALELASAALAKAKGLQP